MSLVWNPAIETLRSVVNQTNFLTACISAFATTGGVRNILDICDVDEFYFITRWRVSELSIGVSDLEVFKLLENRGLPLYINYALHSKLYRFRDGSLLCGSCNATEPGLGIANNSNIETAYLAPATTLEDEIALKKLRDSSIRVTEEIYQHFKFSVSQCPSPPSRVCTTDRDLYTQYLKDDLFLLSDLPATKSPSDLIQCLKRTDSISSLHESMIIDCVNFGVRDSMTKVDAVKQLKIGFCSSPFVQLVVNEIRSKESMSFGTMSAFIHNHCRDVPAPYRSEVKNTVNTLFNWLAHFFEDLSWDIPGARSQVISTTCPFRR